MVFPVQTRAVIRFQICIFDTLNTALLLLICLLLVL